MTSSSAFEQTLAVQDLDVKLAQLRHRHATHPLRDDVDRAVQEASALESKIAAIDERKSELERSMRQLGGQVEGVESKRAATDAKLYGGTITVSKELLALQSEAKSLLEHQRVIEDQELELMEQLEELDAERATLTESLSGVAARRHEAEASLAEAVAELDVDIAAAATDREVVAAEAPAELLARYEALAPQFDGVALARLEDGRCSGCHMQLSAVAVDRLMKAPVDAAVQCEECGRLLVR